MHKNALVLLKITKIAQRWGLRHPKTLCLQRLRADPQTPANTLPPLKNPGYANVHSRVSLLDIKEG